MSVTINGVDGIKGAPAFFETSSAVNSAATGTINFGVRNQAVLYYTQNATANWTINIVGDSVVSTSLNSILDVGQCVTVVFMATQGSTAYYNNVVQIDGSTVTPKWQGLGAPTGGNASGIDVYSYSVIKTGASTFVVLASLVGFK